MPPVLLANAALFLASDLASPVFEGVNSLPRCTADRAPEHGDRAEESPSRASVCLVGRPAFRSSFPCSKSSLYRNRKNEIRHARCGYCGHCWRRRSHTGSPAATAPQPGPDPTACFRPGLIFDNTSANPACNRPGLRAGSKAPGCAIGQCRTARKQNGGWR